MPTKSRKSLLEYSQALSAEWHPTKNGELRPSDVITGTSRKVWWQCKNGHEWVTEVRNRVEGGGCPYCSGRKVSTENNLAVVNPEIAKEWHPTKNGNLKPTDVLPSIAKIIWWLCPNGHEYEATINNRSSKGRGCPYCSGRYATVENNLKNAYPKIAVQWHPTNNGELSPDHVTPKSGKKVWWKCKHGHAWQQIVGAKVLDKRECPVCLTLAEKNVELSKQWHPTKNGTLQPIDVSYGSDQKIWWQCPFGHEWIASISARTINNSGCPYCTAKSSDIEIRIYTELKKIFDEVVWRSKIEKNEVDVFVKDINLAIELDGHYWHKSRGEKDQKKTALLKSKGINLIRLREEPLVLVGQFDLHFNNTQPHKDVINNLLIRIKDLFDIHNDKKIDSYLVNSQFLNDEEFRTLSASLPKPEWENSLEMRFPKLAKHWNYEKNFPLLPSMYSPQSNKRVWWKCEKGHEWQTAINHRSAKNIGCPYCSGRYATNESNLQIDYPELAKEWHPSKNGELRPENVKAKSNLAVWWQCINGHEWQAIVCSRHASGCPYCSGRKASESNNLLSKYPEIAQEWDYQKNGKRNPVDYVPGSSIKVWWKCKNGHEWEAVIRNRVKSSKCPKCKT